MTDYERITQIAIQNNNVFKTKMITAEGIRKEKIKDLLEAGIIERIGYGIYVLGRENIDEYYEFQQKCPKGIFSYGTSAYFWNLSDRVPNVLNCTVPRGYNTSRLNVNTKVRYHYIPKNLYDIGITETKSPQGASIMLYDRERTICDLVRDRKKVDMQLFSTALNLYFKGREKNIRKLMKYGKEFHITEELEKYMEVLQ
jgi:predicted transcriptional regulator of viral defense system